MAPTLRPRTPQRPDMRVALWEMLEAESKLEAGSEPRECAKHKYTNQTKKGITKRSALERVFHKYAKLSAKSTPSTTRFSPTFEDLRNGLSVLDLSSFSKFSKEFGLPLPISQIKETFRHVQNTHRSLHDKQPPGTQDSAVKFASRDTRPCRQIQFTQFVTHPLTRVFCVFQAL